MTRSFFKNFLVLVTLAIPFAASFSHAEEGLWTNRSGLTAAQNAIWNSVFLFYNGNLDGSGDTNYGSAFPVKIINSPNGVKIQFLTAYHVVAAICSGNHCPDTYLFQGYQVRDGDGPTAIWDGKVKSIRFSQVELVASNPGADLALLQVEASNDEEDKMKTIKGIPLMATSKGCAAQQGESIIAIGYPSTSFRPHPKVQYDGEFGITERWSRGILNTSPMKDRRGVLVGSSTVDALPSSSGSPMLNSNGEVIGLMDSIETSVEKGMPYIETPTPDGKSVLYSLLVQCQTINNFLSSN